MGKSSKTVVVLLAACLVWPAVGHAALDRGFGRGGVVDGLFVAPPTSSGAGYGPLALAPHGDGGVDVLGLAAGRLNVVRLRPDGRRDGTFGAGGTWMTPTSEPVGGGQVLRLPDRGLLIVRTVERAGETWLRLERLTRRGRAASAFGDAGVVESPLAPAGGSVELVQAILDLPRRILVVVRVSDRIETGPHRLTVLAFRSDGSVDRGYGDGGRASRELPRYARAAAARQVADGRLLVLGRRASQRFGGFEDVFLVRFTRTGRPDRGLGGDGLRFRPIPGPMALFEATIGPGGRSVLVGRPPGAGPRGVLVARLRPNGALDPTFGRRGLSLHSRLPQPNDLVVAPDGRLFATFIVRNGCGLRYARFAPDGRRELYTAPCITRGGERETGASALAVARGRLFIAGLLNVPKPEEDAPPPPRSVVVRYG